MATSALTPFNAFYEHLAEGVHNLQTGAFVLALSAAASAPDLSTHSTLSDLTTISYTNLSSRALTVSSSSQTSGTYRWVLADLTLSASGGSVAAFRYLTVYNDTPTSPADPLVGRMDYGADLTLASGESLVVDFDGTNGALSLAAAA